MSLNGKDNKQPKLGVARLAVGTSSKPRSRSSVNALLNSDERYDFASTSTVIGTSSQTQKRNTRPSAMPVQCPDCMKVLSSRGNLNRHKRMSHGGQRFHCNIPGCVNSFGQAHDLRRHIRRKHSGDS